MVDESTVKKWAYDLYEAAYAGDAKKVKTLLDQGYLKDSRVYDDESRYVAKALYFAATNKYTAIVELLLEAGINPDLKAIEGLEWTALHAAASSNSIDIAKLLINHGANINILNAFDNAPLDVAKEPEMTELLLKAGALQSQCQKLLRINYNLLIEEFKKYNITKFDSLNVSGSCDGLSKFYLLYASQHRLEEFNFYINFINNLATNEMQSLAKRYASKESIQIKLKHGDSKTYSFDKLLDFMEKVYEGR